MLTKADQDQQLEEQNRQFMSAEPTAILQWAWETFRNRIAVSSSFQTQSLPLLHMISQVAPQMPVLFLDTGYHFPETLRFRDRLREELGLNIRILEPIMGHDGFLRQHGSLYMSNPDRCCYLNKTEPMQKALQQYDAWISGIRRDQTNERAGTPIVALDANGKYKICPLAYWKREQVWQYIHDHDLPSHPLFSQGYSSIGCQPCTRQVREDEDERAGRWSGLSKEECGLHIQLPGDGRKQGEPISEAPPTGEDEVHDS